jgi:hypothetical protein
LIRSHLLGVALASVVLTTSPCAQKEAQNQPTVTPPVTPKETGQDVREMPRSQPWKPGDPVREVPDLRQTAPVTPTATAPSIVPSLFAGDLHLLPVIRSRSGKTARLTRERVTLTTSDGTFAFARSGDRAGPIRFASLWHEGPCTTARTQVDALYDPSASRWVLGGWATPSPDSAFHYCLAVARTGDPIKGGWYLYAFPIPMYSAASSLEMTSGSYTVVIRPGGSQTAFSFDRARMVEGVPATPARELRARNPAARHDH